MRSDRYQLVLIILGVAAVACFGVFLNREIFPEYKMFQNRYIDLEKFRSSYTGEAPPPFQTGVKQIVIEREDKGPPVVDRCISCHVAMEVGAFSPTKIARDINGNIILDAVGDPVKIPNDNYVWGKLDQRVAEFTNPQVLEQLRTQGKNAEANARLKEAARLTALKTVQIDGRTYDVTKVIAMHPLIGKETRPFEFHSIEEYGCTSCHSGNGRALTTEKAHGPVFEGQYEEEYMGPTPIFTESDPKNDPTFARMFNHKPGGELLFQTTPIFAGALIQAKCVQCHQTSAETIEHSIDKTAAITTQHRKRANAIRKGYEEERQSLASLLAIHHQLTTQGLPATLKLMKERSNDYTLPPLDLDAADAQLKFVTEQTKDKALDAATENALLSAIDQKLNAMLGSATLASQLKAQTTSAELAQAQRLEPIIDQFVATHQQESDAKGSLFVKAAAWSLEKSLLQHVKDTESSLHQAVSDQQFLSNVTADIDFLTQNYQQGQQLYLSQACYACHRIAALSRGGIGPELTTIGNNYPWYIKESIVWPQADLKTSTMPNYRLDHEELRDLMTYLLAQTGKRKADSDVGYKTAVQQWEAGRKLPWEQPIQPAQIHDLRYSMTVFATEGCAACHRLKGFESDVGYAVEKEGQADFATRYKESQWFQTLFPEEIEGSQIVKAIDAHVAEIDQRIVNGVRQNSILEEIERNHPGHIEGFYTPFKYALRAKNHDFTEQLAATQDPHKRADLMAAKDAWQARIRRILMVFVQEYGFGRLICPRPNWSGIFRSDEWLMEHFHSPSAHAARSIMPPFPFDDSKFAALTYMLDHLAIRNRNEVREIWTYKGFDPAEAFHIHCAQCHGDLLLGNGPVSIWIYPIPKNLRNPDFMRNLTKERVKFSITHGVKGTPMPPWGEVAVKPTTADGIAVLTRDEIDQLAEWLFSNLPGGRAIQDVPKWEYTPKDVLEELHNEGGTLPAGQPAEESDTSLAALMPQLMLPLPVYYAALNPTVSLEEPAEIFDRVANPPSDPDPYSYMIKKQFYTRENIEAGRAFFELNCAPCHGKEADGTGPRAEVMQEAKPRMLTNLDWLDMRDDLRLLRSIKYGVPGTAMTPWGDETSSLLRLQLVIFIRSLSESREDKKKLDQALYQAFGTPAVAIENARIDEYSTLLKQQETYARLREERKALDRQVEEGKATPKAAADKYQEELQQLIQVNLQKTRDERYSALKTALADEETLYENIGKSLLQNKSNPEALDHFLNLVASDDKHYTFKDHKLQLNWAAEQEKQLAQLGQQVIQSLHAQLATLREQLALEKGKSPSSEKTAQLNKLDHESTALNKLIDKTISDLESAVRSREQQRALFQQMQDTQ